MAREQWLRSLIQLAKDDPYVGPNDWDDDRDWAYLVTVALQYGNSAVPKPTREEFSNLRNAVKRLEYLRGEIRAQRISLSEIVELQSLAPYITDGDVELLEWAGVPEGN